MLNILLATFALLMISYVLGILISVPYRLVRMAELKVSYDNTRNKDTKNECTNLTRHHMRGIRESWKWPAIIFAGALSAIKWGLSQEVR